MLNEKQISEKIVSIRKSTAKVKADIQTVLVNVAGHVYNHGDVTNYTRLLDATRGMDRVAIIRWMNEFGFAKVGSDGKVSLNKAAKNNATFTDGSEVVEYLKTQPEWFDFTPNKKEAAKTALDVNKRILSLVEKFRTAYNEHEPVTIDVEAARLALAKMSDMIDAFEMSKAKKQRAEALKAPKPVKARKARKAAPQAPQAPIAIAAE